MIRAKITISGKVQGVFFRQFTQGIAEELGITGFARNQADGSVYIVADGYEARVKEFIERVRKGSPGSKVSFVSVMWEQNPSEQYSEFSVRSISE